MLCEAGSREQVTRLVAAGGSPLARDEFGMIPLHIAARKGNTEAVLAMLDHGVAVDTRDKQGWTALHHASWCGFDETMTLLLQWGACSNAPIMPEEEGVIAAA